MPKRSPFFASPALCRTETVFCCPSFSSASKGWKHKKAGAWQSNFAVQGGEILKRYLNFLTALSAVLGLMFATVLGTADYFTANSYTVTQGDSLSWNNGALSIVKTGTPEVSASTAECPESCRAELMLYHTIPVKTVQLNIVGDSDSFVVACGMPFGIKMFTNGVVIVGLSDIKTQAGAVNPASDAGLQTGDIILAVNGKTTDTNTDVEKAIESCGGSSIKFSINRDGQKFSAAVSPVRSESDGQYKVGLWVRDSTAGIGTMTFYDPAGKCFAGLGHGICDSDTGRLMPLLSGDVVPVTISGITKGLKGTPGELRGYFTDEMADGTLFENVASGVYGTLNKTVEGKPVKVAMKQEVKTGPAQIYTTISGNTPKLYSIEIEKIDYRDGVQSKNLILHITDQQLLSQTGGIVQGMSGSPIIQDGKLVGAVTHVFVNDPTRGYGIFAESMLTESKNVSKQEQKLAS